MLNMTIAPATTPTAVIAQSQAPVTPEGGDVFADLALGADEGAAEQTGRTDATSGADVPVTLPMPGLWGLLSLAAPAPQQGVDVADQSPPEVAPLAPTAPRAEAATQVSRAAPGATSGGPLRGSGPALASVPAETFAPDAAQTPAVDGVRAAQPKAAMIPVEALPQDPAPVVAHPTLAQGAGQVGAKVVDVARTLGLPLEPAGAVAVRPRAWAPMQPELAKPAGQGTGADSPAGGGGPSAQYSAQPVLPRATMPVGDMTPQVTPTQAAAPDDGVAQASSTSQAPATAQPVTQAPQPATFDHGHPSRQSRPVADSTAQVTVLPTAALEKRGVAAGGMTGQQATAAKSQPPDQSPMAARGLDLPSMPVPQMASPIPRDGPSTLDMAPAVPNMTPSTPEPPWPAEPWHGGLGLHAKAMEPAVASPPPQAAPLPMAHNPPADLTQQLAAVFDAPTDRPIELTLTPEELGKVRMLLSPQDDGLRLIVQAERPETLDMMRRHIDQLARDFRELGYGDVSFSFGGNPQQRPDAPVVSDPAEGMDDPPPGPGPVGLPQTLPQLPSQQLDGRLDIRI
ncbi:flagellar hook-length control protein FliK [Paracoccus sp. p4-l81]|uniref:flagellar hook-length control protein FliK n=1 Tax=Paracoccus sp. p4-l81 TaxID=3342806 RepID=UPI0035B91069